MNTDKIYAQAIANEYSVKKTSKVVALKKLDRKAKESANIFTYTFGIFSTLVFGAGMCLAMQVIGNGPLLFVLGICIGILGIVGLGTNYFIYKKLLEKGKLQTATFCGQQGRISRTVRAILSGQPGISAGQRVLRPTDQY